MSIWDDMTKALILASQVLDVLTEKGPLKNGPHAWLREVRNATGYSHSHPRYADALVVSLWPSRGIWFAGVEVKVQRSDWLKELNNPRKAESIQKFCHYWWIATPPDIVKPDELPKTWGHVVVNGKTVKVIRQAPELKPSALEPDFVASVLRNTSSNQQALINEALIRGRRDTEEKLEKDRAQFDGFEEQLNKINTEKSALERKVTNAENDIQNLRRTLREFEEMAGIPVGTIAERSYRSERDNRNAANYYKLAQLLGRIDEQRWVAEVKALHDAIETVTRTAEEAKTGT